MNKYPVGINVAVSIPLVDANGAALTPTGLSYVVRDEAGDVLAGPTPIGTLTSPANVTVPAAVNNSAGARQVEVSVTTAAGVYVCDAAYLLEATAGTLVIPTSSFQTYLEAEVIAAQMSNLAGWPGASKAQRIVALGEAYDRLTRFTFVARDPLDVETEQSRLIAPWDAPRIRPEMWSIMEESYYLGLADRFRLALRKAQVTEADEILTNDPIATRRRAGLMSETIGESSMMFRPGIQRLELSAGRAALKHLTGFIQYSLRIGRT